MYYTKKGFNRIMNSFSNLSTKKKILLVSMILIIILVIFLLFLCFNTKASTNLQSNIEVYLKDQKQILPQDAILTPCKTYKQLLYTSWEYDSNIYIMHRISGKSGPYSGLFKYSPSLQVQFIGLLGVAETSHRYYGITDYEIHVIESRLYSLLTRSK